jgi:hypothetical protein
MKAAGGDFDILIAAWFADAVEQPVFAGDSA